MGFQRATFATSGSKVDPHVHDLEESPPSCVLGYQEERNIVIFSWYPDKKKTRFKVREETQREREKREFPGQSLCLCVHVCVCAYVHGNV